MRIKARQTILENNHSGGWYLATEEDQKTQSNNCPRGHKRSIVGQLNKPIPDIKDLLIELFDQIKHGDQEHQDWLRSKFDDYIKQKSL